MNIILGSKAEAYRTQYIDKFVNKESSYYRERIQELIECSDGLCYWGYLWDCFNSLQLVSEDECSQYLNKFEHFFIMWDINSKDYIYTPNYWKYPKEAVLKVSREDYEKIKDTLPEDIYIFDESFTWSIVLTHETGYDDERYCCFSHSACKYNDFPDKRVYAKKN